MHFRITSDANIESGIGEIVDQISGPTRQHFTQKDYGVGLLGVVVVLVCRDSELDFESRVKFSQDEKKLFIDVILDLEQMKQTNHEQRTSIVVEHLIEEIPSVLHKYSIVDFDEAHFVDDLKIWLKKSP